MKDGKYATHQEDVGKRIAAEACPLAHQDSAAVESVYEAHLYHAFVLAAPEAYQLAAIDHTSGAADILEAAGDTDRVALAAVGMDRDRRVVSVAGHTRRTAARLAADSDRARRCAPARRLVFEQRPV